MSQQNWRSIHEINIVCEIFSVILVAILKQDNNYNFFNSLPSTATAIHNDFRTNVAAPK